MHRPKATPASSPQDPSAPPTPRPEQPAPHRLRPRQRRAVGKSAARHPVQRVAPRRDAGPLEASAPRFDVGEAVTSPAFGHRHQPHTRCHPGLDPGSIDRRARASRWPCEHSSYGLLGEIAPLERSLIPRSHSIRATGANCPCGSRTSPGSEAGVTSSVGLAPVAEGG